MIIPIILAGGSGTRLWPLSRKAYPKQFLRLNSELSLLQETAKRLDGIDHAKPIVICNEEHRFLVAEQLREIDVKADIILEPVGKNTSPSIALAAFHIKQERNADENFPLLVLSADHVINNINKFHESINHLEKVVKKGDFATFGIKPTAPNTGYGYIQAGKQIDGDSNIRKVISFKEKPDHETASEYVKAGNYFWNSGMFLFHGQAYLNKLQEYLPDMHEACANAVRLAKTDLDFIRIDSDHFINKCPAQSIDYAVMEPLSNETDSKLLVIPVDIGWNDVGSWSSIWEISDKDESGNSIINTNPDNIKLFDTKNCLVSSDNKLVTTLGLENLIIIDTPDALLVANKENVQEVKNIVNELAQENRSEQYNHREVYRPWGKFDSIDNGNRYQVKRITVKPGAKLSLQMHHHRAEHWVVVTGTAKVTNGEKQFLLTENESVYIPVGQAHCLENPGVVPLEIIEVQSGAYLGEDDIIRLKDDYGRK